MGLIFVADRTMNDRTYHPWLHRIALSTAVLALLPIVVGAMVTTLDAGMAFPDWPSSDGHGMLTYPWLKSAGDEFIEHGHRLAGMLIGVVTIGLAVTAWRTDDRRWVRWLGVLILGGVIGQGLLGGGRVLLDRRTLAMTHGSFAAIVFALMGVMVLVTSRGWCQRVGGDAGRPVQQFKPLALMTCLAVAGQYVLGGVIRHLGTGLHEHLAGAFIVAALILATLVTAIRSRDRYLIRPALVLFGFLLLQVGLGTGAWVTKFGFATGGYVAVQHAPIQLVLRSTHTVVGMMVLMTSIVYAVRLFRVDALQHADSDRVRPGKVSKPVQEASDRFAVKGGMA